MPKLKLHTQILIGIILGVLAGLVFKENVLIVEPVGEVFIRLLRMIILPLIFASVTMGMVGLGDVRHLKQIGFRTFLYYAVTTFLAVTVGLVLVNLIQPGAGTPLAQEAGAAFAAREIPPLSNILLEIVPKNIFEALSAGNVLSVIFFAILFGITITMVGEKGKPLIAFFDGLNAVMMKLTDLIMLLSPYGVFALMAAVVGKTGIEVFKPLLKYMATVLFGLGIHGFVTIPLLLLLLGRRSPWKFFQAVFPAFATAFSTASSAATLPITLDCLEKRAGVSERTSSFVLPLGATVNMDGTALYEAVAAMFIAQAYGIDVSFYQQVVIVLTATLASIGAAAIPGAGLVTMIIVLNAVNLPVEGIGMILAVDRVLDMCRTSINVWGDASGAAIIDRFEVPRLLRK